MQYTVVCEVPSQNLEEALTVSAPDKTAARVQAKQRFRKNHRLATGVHVSARITKEASGPATPSRSPLGFGLTGRTARPSLATLALLGQLFNELGDQAAHEHPQFERFRTIIDALPEDCILQLTFWPDRDGMAGLRLLIQLELGGVIRIPDESRSKLMRLCMAGAWRDSDRMLEVEPVLTAFQEDPAVNQLLLALQLIVAVPSRSAEEVPS